MSERTTPPAGRNVTRARGGIWRLIGDSSLAVTVGLIFVFLYLPAIVIALYSFDSSSVMSWPIDGFSTQWYEKAFANEALMDGLRNSLKVAVFSIGIALLIGVPAGIGLDRYNFPGKVVFERMLIIPFLLPGVISGIALLTVFLDLGMQLSLTSVIVGHATMLLAVVVILISVGLARWDRTLESAAMDLGANELKTFAFVLWPNIRGAVLGAALLGFAISMDEVARTFFLAGAGNDTLPLVILATLHRTLSPEINAVGTVVLVASLVAIVLWSRLGGSDVGTEQK